MRLVELIRGIAEENEGRLISEVNESIKLSPDNLTSEDFVFEIRFADYHSKYGLDCGWTTIALKGHEKIPALEGIEDLEPKLSLWDILDESSSIYAVSCVQSTTIKSAYANALVKLLSEKWQVDLNSHFAVNNVLD